MIVFRFLGRLSVLVSGQILGKSAVSAAGKLGYQVVSLALDGVSYFTVPRVGNNIKYRVMNKDAKVLDQG